MVSDGHRYVHGDAHETIEKIYDDSKGWLDDMIEDNTCLLAPYFVKDYSKVEYDPIYEAKIKRNIKLGMLNMEPVIKTESLARSNLLQKSKNNIELVEK